MGLIPISLPFNQDQDLYDFILTATIRTTVQKPQGSVSSLAPRGLDGHFIL